MSVGPDSRRVMSANAVAAALIQIDRRCLILIFSAQMSQRFSFFLIWRESVCHVHTSNQPNLMLAITHLLHHFQLLSATDESAATFANIQDGNANLSSAFESRSIDSFLRNQTLGAMFSPSLSLSLCTLMFPL